MDSEKKTNNSTMTLSKYLRDWFVKYKLKKLNKTYYDRLQRVFIHHIEPTIGDINLSF